MAKNPLARRRIRIVAPVLLATVVALLLVWMISTVSASFNPTSQITLGCDGVGENCSIASHFVVPSGDVNFETTVNYTPPEWFVATDADVPDGTVVGTLSSSATLGFAFGTQDTCNQPLSPNFTLYDAITTGACTPDSGDMIGGDWNGYDKVCTGQGNEERAICEYPCFLDDLFPARPIARYYGHWQGFGLGAALNFVVFEPGTSLGAGIPNNEAWGYLSVTVLNNTGAEWGGAAPGALADFCTPLISDNTVNGEADGIALRTNPDCSDTFIFRSWALGQPDADGDGLENALDSCPYDVGTYNPRVVGPTGDADQDGLADECDPDDTTMNADQDGDGYDNAADNCPNVANGIAQAGDPTKGNQTDGDADGIGLACDNNDGSVDGSKPEVLTEEEEEITGGDPCSAGGAATETPTPTATATATPTATGVAGGTTLAAGAAAGDTEISVEDPSGFAVGDTIQIGSGDTAETCTITAISDSTLTLDCTLEFAHEAGEAVVKLEGTATPTATTVAGEGCAPVIPGTYNGLVRLNGVPASAGYEVTASIDGTEWGSTIVSGGRYALDVPQKLPSAEPCFAGGTITFTIDGGVCEPTEDWASGLHDVDLSCAPAATPPPATPPPATPPPATPPATPVKPPTTGAGGLGGDEGMPLWAMLLAGWAALTALAGLGTVATRIVKR